MNKIIIAIIIATITGCSSMSHQRVAYTSGSTKYDALDRDAELAGERLCSEVTLGKHANTCRVR